MPELPDIAVDVDAIATRALGQPLERVRLGSPFLLRSTDPPIAEAEGRRVVALRRLGKRIVLALHPISRGASTGRSAGARLPGRSGLLAAPRGNGLPHAP